jgi:hypothetical protein
MTLLRESSIFKWVYPPIPPTTKFAHVEALGLEGAVEDVAGEILDEARELSKIPFERADAAERRATTLQGAVVIAATFSLAAGTLVAGTDKVHSHVWRIVFAIVFGFVVTAFVAAGVIALQVTGKIDSWHYPDDERLFSERTKLNPANAKLARAGELLRVYGANEALASWKINLATRSARAFRIALGLLCLLAVLFIAYVAS